MVQRELYDSQEAREARITAAAKIELTATLASFAVAIINFYNPPVFFTFSALGGLTFIRAVQNGRKLGQVEKEGKEYQQRRGFRRRLLAP